MENSDPAPLILPKYGEHTVWNKKTTAGTKRLKFCFEAWGQAGGGLMQSPLVR